MKMERGLAFPDADRFMVHELKVDGTYQIENLQAALRHVKNFNCAIDGGAHIGTWSTVMSRHFHQVIAVEPSADTFECLAFNLQQAGLRNVDVRNLALGSAPGGVEMALDADQEARGNTGARFARPGGSIPVETIDSWQLSTLGFLKLDIEGAEYAALCGAKDTLQRCRPVVLFENKWLWTRHYGLPKDAVSKFLTAHGYRLVEKVSRDEIWSARR